jgi:fused signal recognition particle receptor
MNFAEKIKSFFGGHSALSEEFFDELTDLLVEGDIGAKEAYGISDLLRDKCKKEKISSAGEARIILAKLLEDELTKNLSGIQNDAITKPAVILLLGVNGVGKTTTAAKLAAMYRDSFGFQPILAAADTFRAAAIDQLKIHGQRLGLRVVAHQQGGDPAAVIYDAIEAAGTDGIVIADTAGRMHTKSALVEELRKIDRVVESKAAGARYVKYLVLDATTGRNALAQAEIFHEAVSPESVILTKYDSTAKGGVVFSLASGLRLPVAYLCTGEKYGDIQTFNPHNFAREFAGIS